MTRNATFSEFGLPPESCGNKGTQAFGPGFLSQRGNRTLPAIFTRGNSSTGRPAVYGSKVVLISQQPGSVQAAQIRS